MKRVLFLFVFAVAALMAKTAKADTFQISFDAGSLGLSGSGLFTGTMSSAGVYSITGILSGSASDPSFGTSTISAISGAYGADNLLLFPNGGAYFDENGMSFTLANGVTINLFDAVSGMPSLLGYIESNAGGDIFGGINITVTPSVAPTPEPGTLVLVGSGALMAAGAFRRRVFGMRNLAKA